MAYRFTLRTIAAATTILAMGAGLQPAAAAPLKSILFVNPLPNYPAWKLGGKCAADEAKVRGVPYTESGPTDGTLNTTVMIQQLQQGIANNYGALLTFPATDGFVPVLQQARDAGIIVGTLYGAAGTDSVSQVNVGADFAEVGRIMVQALAKREGPQNVGLMVQGPTGAAKAFADAFNAEAAKTSNVKVIAVVNTNDDASKALDQATALLTAHPKINVIASHMGTATQGTTAAIKAKDLVGKVVMLANGPAGGGAEGLEDGTVYKLLMQNVCGAGKQIIDGVVDISEGKTVPKQVSVGVTMVGKGEVQPLLDKGWQ